MVSNDDRGWVYDCNRTQGVYYNDYAASHQKIYYNFNHLLHAIARSYQEGAYYYDYGEWRVNRKLLTQIERENLSQQDQQRYQQLKTLLIEKAQEYHNASEYMKVTLIQEMAYTYDQAFISSLLPYLNDKNPKVVETTLHALGKVGTHDILPRLLRYLHTHQKKYQTKALFAIANIVNKDDEKLLNTLYPLLEDSDRLVRLGVYKIIDTIRYEGSSSHLKRLFAKEERSAKVKIVQIFGKMGGSDTLPLLESYLKEVNQMDFSQDSKDCQGKIKSHPKYLKQEIEKAMKFIKQRAESNEI